MIMDTIERLPLYEANELIPYAGAIRDHFLAEDPKGLSIEVRPKQYDTKADEKRRFEVHDKTIDLMLCREGGEIIHICPENELERGEDLPDGADGRKLNGGPGGTAVRLKEGYFVAIFPGEAHMVGGHTDGKTPGAVNKWVVKVPCLR